MIRTKVTLVYLALIALMTGAIVLLIQVDVSSELQESAETSLRRSANLAEQTARLDEAALLARAKYIASRSSLYEAMQGEGGLDNTKDEDGEELNFDERRHLIVHEKLLAQKYKLDDLVQDTEGRRNIELDPMLRRPHEMEVFMALDSKGIGVAALGKDRYKWFGDDVSERYPEVRKLGVGVGAARVEYWLWSFGSEEERLHRVALAPIQPSESDDAMGVVVIGTVINDGIAAEKQRVLVGGDETSDESELAPAVAEIVYINGDEVEASTFSSDLQSDVAAVLMESSARSSNNLEEVHEVEVGEDVYLTMMRTLRPHPERPFRVAVMVNKAAVLSLVGQLRANVLLIGFGFFVVGAVLLFMLVLGYVRRLEAVEEGIQEVIAGNKDYEWEPVKSHPLQASLAQSLNLMSAFLQGKPMPDAETESGQWSADSFSNPTAGQGEGTKPKVGGVDMPMIQSLPKGPEDDDPEDA